MTFRIGSDVDRFKSIIKDKFKHNLGKFVSSNHILGQQGGKIIKIPLNNIDLPIFSYGGKQRGGTGIGPGDVGDPVGSEKKPGKGKQAGDDDESHDFSTEFTPDELAQIMREHLELPNIENKGKGGIETEKSKYTSIANQGSESLRHYKRTYKEALKREISSGNYDPRNPKIIPIRDDKRYKSAATVPSPDVNTVVFYCLDASGSMGEKQKHIAKSMVFWIDLLLSSSYKKIDSVFIAHDTKAQEVSKEDFFKISSAGGTHISSAYELCYDMIQKRYPFSNYNSYVFSFSDGGNSAKDNEKSIKLLGDQLLNNLNMFAYGQINSEDSDEYMDYLSANFKNNDKVMLAQINDVDDILNGIKSFFKDGK